MIKPRQGDIVTCKVAVEAYYSNCGGNPRIVFEPGMRGVVVKVAPKVCIVRGPQCDGESEFLVVDFDCPITLRKERVGLNFCNAVVV